VTRALLFFVCVFVSYGSVQTTGKQGASSASVTKLRGALAELERTPGDRTAQIRYLEAFPSTYKEYLLLFDLGQPLYDGHEYVESLSSLATRHEQMVGSLLVSLSKDAHYDADAPSYLQHATCAFAGEHTKTFLTLLKQLPPHKQANLITFLADVENHSAYPEYQVVIDRLKALGEVMLAKKLEDARAEREKQPHD